jgi:2Fe-2S ferredoxin
MPKILLQPLGITIEAERGVTVMAAAQAKGYYWPTTCAGEGRCSTCAATVLRGAENLSSMGRAEKRTLVSELGPRSIDANLRLACQARLDGDGTVEIHKAGVRRSDLLLGLRAKEPGE